MSWCVVAVLWLCSYYPYTCTLNLIKNAVFKQMCWCCYAGIQEPVTWIYFQGFINVEPGTLLFVSRWRCIRCFCSLYSFERNIALARLFPGAFVCPYRKNYLVHNFWIIKDSCFKLLRKRQRIVYYDWRVLIVPFILSTSLLVSLFHEHLISNNTLFSSLHYTWTYIELYIYIFTNRANNRTPNCNLLEFICNINQELFSLQTYHNGNMGRLHLEL